MSNKEFDTVHSSTNRIFRIPDSQSLALCIEWYAGIWEKKFNSTDTVCLDVVESYMQMDSLPAPQRV